MVLRPRLSPLPEFRGISFLTLGSESPKKVDEEKTKEGADHSVRKNLGPAFEKADENEKRLKTLRTYFAKWKKVLEPAPLPVPAESTAANQRTISLIAALALTIFVIANRKKMPNKGSMLNFLNRNPVKKARSIKPRFRFLLNFIDS